MQGNHQEKRQTIRYRSQAWATIPGFIQENAFVKDMSVTGCCIEFKTSVKLKVGEQYTIAVSAEIETQVGRFDLLAEARWIQPRGNGCEIGFLIISSPTGKQFERYVDYLATNTTYQ
jgi:hypothetical protein